MAKDDIFQYRDCQCLQSVVVMYFNLIISEVSVIDINESLVMEVQKSRQEGYNIICLITALIFLDTVQWWQQQCCTEPEQWSPHSPHRDMTLELLREVRWAGQTGAVNTQCTVRWLLCSHTRVTSKYVANQIWFLLLSYIID